MDENQDFVKDLAARIAFYYGRDSKHQVKSIDMLREALDSATQLPQDEAWRAGAAWMREQAKAQAHEWHDAYPADIFIRWSGKFMRHVTSKLRDEIGEIEIPTTPPLPSGGAGGNAGSAGTVEG